MWTGTAIPHTARVMPPAKWKVMSERRDCFIGAEIPTISLRQVARSFALLSQDDVSEIQLWNKSNSQINRDTSAGGDGGEEEGRKRLLISQQDAKPDSTGGLIPTKANSALWLFSRYDEKKAWSKAKWLSNRPFPGVTSDHFHFWSSRKDCFISQNQAEFRRSDQRRITGTFILQPVTSSCWPYSAIGTPSIPLINKLNMCKFSLC